MNLRKTAGRVRKLFSVPLYNPELMQAQHAAFSRQVPLLYLILLTNTWIVAYTHFPVAPAYLTVHIPAVLTMIGVFRLVSWWRSRNRPLPAEQVARALRGTNRLAAALAVSFVAWGLALFPYGDAHAQGHVAFFMGITVVGCIFCLMHLRSAALIVTLIVNVAFVAFFATRGIPALTAISMNVAMVSAALMVILQNYYRDFTHLIDSRKELMLKQAELVAKQTETQALSDANYRLANLDSLTGLSNRRGFFAALEEQLAKAEADGSRFTVGIVDLDGFKPVNDTHGHIVGDALLVEVGRRLGEVCGENVFLSRLGGDEFGVIVRDGRDEAAIAALGGRICHAMRRPFMLSDATLRLTGSTGFASYPASAVAADALFERADYALYHAKRNAPGTPVLFSAAHDAEIRHHAAIEQHLRSMDMDAELSVVFQPIVDVRSERPVAFEALARWNSPGLGMVPPSLFIPAAEHAGLVAALTRTLLAKALAEAARWPCHIRLSFNLSAKDIASAEGVMRIASSILGSGVDPRRIDLEITETAVIQDFMQARTAIENLKTLGVGISLDDFGTGYSSLTQLHKMPLDKIKVDRSFVTGIQENPASYKIVRSLLSLSRDMGLGCVVEGVESRDELGILRELGATLVQGYYYSKPLSGADVPAYLDAAGEGPAAVRRSA